MNILFITEVSPFPCNAGERIRSVGLLKAFAQLAEDVTAIIGNEDKVDLEHYSVPNTTFIEYDYHERNKNGFVTLMNIFRKDEKLVQILDKLISEKSFDVVFLDYFFMGQYIDYFHQQQIPVIYGTHNAQSRLTWQNIFGSLPNRVKFSVLYICYYLHERIYFKNAEFLIAVSKEDAEFYKKCISRLKTRVVPNFIDFDQYSYSESKERYLIITGNFYSFQNRYGAKWFIENIWKKGPIKGFSLILAGKGSREFLNSLESGKRISHTKATGEVKDIKPLIAKAFASIVPLLHGSGTRLKCIESMALKTQVISTSLGAEGIEHEGSIIIADSAKEFREKLLQLIDKSIDHTEKAYRVAKEKYSLKAASKMLDSILKELK